MEEKHLEGFCPHRPWSYGTAGFRGPAQHMPFVAYRCGIVAALRALQTGAPVGLMVTASHNPIEDNGVKLVESDGSMLSQEWETIATDIVNDLSLHQTVHAFLARYSTGEPAATIQITIGRDTRPSSPKLAQYARDGVALALKTVTHSVHDIGVVTTPILHWVVWQRASVQDYYANLKRAYADAVGPTLASTPITIDCANGVATQALCQLQAWENTNFYLVNTGEGILNHRCGADFVQKQKSWPSSSPSQYTSQATQPLASLDGDADRLVLAIQLGDKLTVIDGDRIAVFIADFIQSQLEIAGLDSHLKVTVVQTAYANGASTHHLKAAGARVICTKTGIKHLEKAAKTADIAIYFEANGHGSVLYSKRAIAAITPQDPCILQKNQLQAVTRLSHIRNLANPVVGDAIADLLLIKAILTWKQQEVHDMLSLYVDLPSHQKAVEINDRSIIVTCDAERTVASPPFLQPLLNKTLTAACIPRARCFVRPSGTENIVRIYVEGDAAQSSICDLADRIAGHLKECS